MFKEAWENFITNKYVSVVLIALVVYQFIMLVK